MSQEDVKEVLSVTLGKSFVKLVKTQQYEVHSDSKSHFLRIIEELEPGRQHNLKIIVQDQNNQHITLNACCQPKG